MLRIALCDDDFTQRTKVTQMLQDYLARQPEGPGKVSAFTSRQELLDSISAGGEDHDLYIIDAPMPGLSGVELGVRLRELGGKGAIIYLLSPHELSQESYRAHALGCLLKPVDPELLSKELDYAVGVIRREHSACVLVKTKGGTVTLPLNDLLYVELHNRLLRYHLLDGSVIESLTLRTSFQNAVESILSDGRFFRCGTSMAVNLHHVRGLDKDNLYLDRGRTVSLPRGMLGEAKRRWSAYWRGDPLADKALCVKCSGHT